MKRVNDFVVGITVLVVTVALVAGVLWVQQANVGRRVRQVTARFRDVGLARVGNDAVVRGVRAGHIDAIERSAAHDAGYSQERFSSCCSSCSNCSASMGRSSSNFNPRMRSAI